MIYFVTYVNWTFPSNCSCNWMKVVVIVINLSQSSNCNCICNWPLVIAEVIVIDQSNWPQPWYKVDAHWWAGFNGRKPIPKLNRKELNLHYVMSMPNELLGVVPEIYLVKNFFVLLHMYMKETPNSTLKWTII